MLFRYFLLVISICFLPAEAQEYFNLSVTAGPGGTTSPSGTVRWKRGNHMLVAYPDSGYLFETWSIVSDGREAALGFRGVFAGAYSDRCHAVNGVWIINFVIQRWFSCGWQNC